MTDYVKIANDARKKVLELIYKAQVSHLGSNFSCIDLMAVLFEKIDLDKDKFVLSAGWKAATLYYFLWRKGRITEDELNSFCMPGSKFIGLAENIHKDIPIAGGSMGLGTPGAVGLALAKKMKGEAGTVYVLMSDGELQCGTTWESVLIAAQHKLDNLVVIVDENGWQAMGKVQEILDVSVKDFLGWDEWVVDGHSHVEIERSFGYLRADSRPKMIHAKTIKGKGVSFMEDQNIFHYKQLSENEYKEALKELSYTII